MEIICVDGKALRGTVLAGGSSPDIVSAYSPSTDITLATEACHEKSNEIKALPRLIDRIDVAGKVIYNTKNTRLSVEPGKGLYSLSTSLTERAVSQSLDLMPYPA